MEPKRTRNACSRCRRQKLRCDYQRPCPLCVRANAECIEATERTWRTNRPKSAAYQAQHATQEPSLERRTSARVQTRAKARRESSVTTRTATAGGHFVQSAKSSLASHAEPEEPVPPEQHASALHLVGKIFQKYRVVGPSRTLELDAIPSSDSPGDGSAPVESLLLPVTDLIGIDLPPLDVVNALLDSYRDSVHWYLHVLHEPSLRARLKPIAETGLASRQQRPLLLLALIVLSFGAKVISQDAREIICRQVALDEVVPNMIAAVERWYLPSMDLITVDTIAYSFLLATYYLCNRQTRPAFITMGTTVRAAQFIGLHQEAHWGHVDAVEKEARRRAWWSVFIGAGFISMSWGTPPMLSEADCNVRQPLDGEDTLEQCPGFSSLERREDGELRPVTVGSYNRYKADMYKIAVSIMRQIYFTQHPGPDELVRQISKLHQRLLAWEKSIPPELRMESHSPIDSDDGHNVSVQRVFAIQALTLRVAYDNVQIFLFRPLISIGGIPRSHGCSREHSPVPTRRTSLNNVPSSLVDMAQQQCWTSATRTSMVAQRADLLKHPLFGMPAIHVGVHSFSAGVMLGLLALLEPLSARGQESKRGIARIIQIPKVTKMSSPVWSQMTQVLTDLMHVIAAEETKALIADPAGVDFGATPPRPDNFGDPPDHYREGVCLYQRSRSAETEASIAVDHGSRNHGLDRQPTTHVNPEPETIVVNVCQDPQTTSMSDHAMSGMANYQEHSQGVHFDMMDFWGPPQAGGLADPLHGMSQLWMWDGSFSYH